MQLEGKKVLITGGSSGIGKATAKMLKMKGADVLITGRDRDKLSFVGQEIGVVVFCCDVAISKEVESLFEFVKSEFGGLDILVNNAGIGAGWGTIDELDMNALKKVYEVNVFGAAHVGKLAAQIFKAQKSGNIINIASTASMKGYANGSIYASSKFALRGMTQCWQAELRPFNVRVFQVNPSEVPTAFGQENRVEKENQSNKLRAKEIAHVITSQLEMDNRGYVPEVTVHATNPF